MSGTQVQTTGATSKIPSATFLRTILIRTFVLLGATVSEPTYAAQPSLRRGTSAFDGIWSVVMRIVHVRGDVMRDGSGRPRRIFGTIQDVTALRGAEQQARENERRHREVQMELAHANRIATLGQLTASIAHEVNQPIGAMCSNAEAALRWLDRQPPDLEEVRQSLARIVSDGHRAAGVVGRIRNLVKKAPPRKDCLDINGAIREVIELTRCEARKNAVFVQTELADDLPIVEGDRVQLQQVMLNLIVNAIQAMSRVDARRDLHVTTMNNVSGDILIAVCDSGSGLSMNDLDRLFEPFYTTKSDGMGMGLPICRSIIEAHGGRLWASAKEPRGAVFQFTLPPCQRSSGNEIATSPACAAIYTGAVSDTSDVTWIAH
jgi:C4-dicarboxylate-specific signal transduction histidine kinase